MVNLPMILGQKPPQDGGSRKPSGPPYEQLRVMEDDDDDEEAGAADGGLCLWGPGRGGASSSAAHTALAPAPGDPSAAASGASPAGGATRALRRLSPGSPTWPSARSRSRGAASAPGDYYAGGQVHPAVAAAAETPGAVEFMWNGNPCVGTAIHEAALLGQLDAVADILQTAPGELNTRFVYSALFKGLLYEGSGCALHLAASRGHLDVLKLLLCYGAPCDSKVIKDGKDHCDVLHTAVFGEGVSNLKLVRYLLDEVKVRVTPDSDGLWPLHIAFRTGCLEQIRMLRQAMHTQGVLDKVEFTCSEAAISEEVPSPLLLGIQTGRMTERKLAKAAAHTPASLRTFIDHEPRCVPHFIRNIKYQQIVSASSLAAHLTGRDLATVIRVSPLAARALLDGVLETPVNEGLGWHSLPKRISFAPKDWVEQLRYLLNPGREILVFYETDTTWKYDVARFEAPPWHDELNVDRGKPIFDAEIKVCHVPDIICADFFAALGVAGTEDYDEVLKHPVVNGSIEYAWWQGACKADMLQVFLSLWGLVLLILESWLLHEYGDQNLHLASHHAQERRLRPLKSGDVDWNGGLGDDGMTQAVLLEISVAADFIGAKGVVDFFHELLQFIGCLSIGRGNDYLNVGNAWDLARAAILMTLFFDRTSQLLRVAVIFICWMRLLDVFTSAEKIAAALLPIKRSGKGLLPVIMVTIVSFLAFMHSFYFAWGRENASLQEVLFRTFSTLITSELPADPEAKSPMELVLTYGAVIFFSIFILNIFIGVIGQQYEEEKERVQITLKYERAQCCLNFLLRARVLPCGLCSRGTAYALTVLSAMGVFWLQLAGFDAELHWGLIAVSKTHSPTMLRRSLFALLQLAMILLQYQNHEAPWASRCRDVGMDGCDKKRRYLWLALPITRDEVTEDMEFGRVTPDAGTRRSSIRHNWSRVPSAHRCHSA